MKTNNAPGGLMSGLLLTLSLCLTGSASAQVAPPAPPNLPTFTPPPALLGPAPDPLALLTNVPPPPPLPTGTAVVTDQADYAPGVTAHIRGQEFQAGETVRLQVLHADGTSDGGEDHQPWTVVAGTNGAFQATWHVCEDDCVGSTLKLTATGQTSGKTAQAIFTDAPAAPTYQLLKSFDMASSGGYLNSGVIQGTDGKLYGTASQGGSTANGTVFKLNTDGSSFSVLKGDFNYSMDGATLNAGLMQVTDGAIFGAAQNGGSSGNGTVFKLNTDGTGFSVVKGDFNYSTDGGGVYSSLIKGLDGALYGTAPQGGSNGVGTVFKVNPDGSGFTVLKSLGSPPPGIQPYGGLIKGTDGALYGTTSGGGSANGGTVFKLNPDGTGLTVLKNFDYYTTGGYLFAGVIQGTDGALYGTAQQGGSSGYGTVFKLNPDGTGFTVLKNFDYYTTGGNPYGKLLQGTDGALYGTTPSGGSSGYGTVFKLNTDGTSFTVLKGDFDGFTSGSSPLAGLMQGFDGTLYGVTFSGTVFKLYTDGTGFAVLQNFNFSTTGAVPYGELIQGPDGTLYGTAAQGGSGAAGTVFKLNPDGTGFTALWNFDYYTTGGNPYGRLAQGADGALYGTARQGGTGNWGTVFKVNPDGTGFTVLKNFDYYTTGGNPYGKLAQGTDGALYGTTSTGGFAGCGTLFKLNPDGTGFNILKYFVGPVDFSETGGFPVAELMQGPDGTLYGTALRGGRGGIGNSGFGTVFKLNPDGTGFTVLKSFDNSTTGSDLFSRLMLGMDGALYGTAASGGGSYYGTVFKLNSNGTGFTVLKNFDYSTTGGSPQGGLLQRADGTIYGTASSGGNSGAGTVFQLNPDGSDFSVFLNFDGGLGGSQPHGKLIQGADGSLYGTTYQGGNGAGTVFRLVFPSSAPINHPPVAKCKNVTVSAGANCTAAASIDDGSFDPDTGDTITLTQTPAGPYAPGYTLVTLTVTDNHNVFSTCTATVTVKDTTAPVTPVLADVTAQCSVSVTAPTTTDNCAGTVTGTTSDPLTYNSQGTFTVHWTFSDGHGNSSSANQTVIVHDTELPTITCPANKTVVPNAGQCSATVTWTAPVASDNCSGVLVNCTPTSGSSFPLGMTTVNCTATDAAGNRKNCSFTVTVLSRLRVEFRSPLESDTLDNNDVNGVDAAGTPEFVNFINVGQDVPHKIKLFDCNGTDVTDSANVTVTLKVTQNTGNYGSVAGSTTLTTASTGVGGGPTGLMTLLDHHYQYNLKTKTGFLADTDNDGKGGANDTYYYRSYVEVKDATTGLIVGREDALLETR